MKESKTRDYLHYHTSSDKILCKYPTFSGSSSYSMLDDKDNRTSNINIDNDYINSFE